MNPDLDFTPLPEERQSPSPFWASTIACGLFVAAMVGLFLILGLLILMGGN